MVENTLELRLLTIAQRIADMYMERINKEDYRQLCNAINVCNDYFVNKGNDWWVMYDVVLYDDGIWEFSMDSSFDDEIKDMWGLETIILTCNCYLGCVAEKQNEPQDMEIRGENIPEFVELLENIIKDSIDFERIFDFWAERMCY